MNQNTLFDIDKIISRLKEKRQIFVSEADFQLEMAWIIKYEYPDAKVRLEYTPQFNSDMHIDILVIIKNSWIPIELKYKTKGCTKELDDEFYNLKNHGAKDVSCYKYLKDIQRIESIRTDTFKFVEGYTVFITNDLSYIRKPAKENCVYKDFSLEEGIVKTGILNWAENTGAGTKKNCEEPIKLEGKYKVHWEVFSKIDDTPTGTFVYLANRICK